MPLCQKEVSRAVREQQLSQVWTVEYTQDLLLLGGLLPESVWLAYHLGDWKTAVSLSLAYSNYCSGKLDFTLLRRRELHLPVDLEAKTIFQVELECLLSSKSDSQECKDDVSLTGQWQLHKNTLKKLFDSNQRCISEWFIRTIGRTELGHVTSFHPGDSESFSHGWSGCDIFTSVFLAGHSQSVVCGSSSFGA